MVKRKVKDGVVIVLGRRYRLDPSDRKDGPEGQFVWVDEDGVCKTDLPKWGIRTDRQVGVYWPTRFDWWLNATLDEPDNPKRKGD